MVTLSQLDQALAVKIQKRRGHRRHASDALTLCARKGFLESVGIARLDQQVLESKCLRCSYHFIQASRAHAWVVHDHDFPECRDGIFQNFEPLALQIGAGHRQAGDIASRLCQALNESVAKSDH